MADGEGGAEIVVFGDGEVGTGFGVIEAAHAVDEKTERGGLDREVGEGGPGIMEGIAIGRAVAGKSFLADGETEEVSIAGPFLVFGDEAGEDSGEIARLILGGQDKTPGLFVETGSGPARSFKETKKDIRGDGGGGEIAGTPAAGEQIVEWLGFWHT